MTKQQSQRSHRRRRGRTLRNSVVLPKNDTAGRVRPRTLLERREGHPQVQPEQMKAHTKRFDDPGDGPGRHGVHDEIVVYVPGSVTISVRSSLHRRCNADEHENVHHTRNTDSPERSFGNGTLRVLQISKCLHLPYPYCWKEHSNRVIQVSPPENRETCYHQRRAVVTRKGVGRVRGVERAHEVANQRNAEKPEVD